MKLVTLLFLSVLIAPALALSSVGAKREAWPTVILGIALLAVAVGGIHYLT